MLRNISVLLNDEIIPYTISYTYVFARVSDEVQASFLNWTMEKRLNTKKEKEILKDSIFFSKM